MTRNMVNVREGQGCILEEEEVLWELTENISVPFHAIGEMFTVRVIYVRVPQKQHDNAPQQ
jgi:hypothetical protein